ncbi:MAG: hypothetical protein J7641_10215 [Cyanobacteria bacterium SID2]|nr:hypothetical protein [Cyanobacteria bacterium SID2]
MNSSILWGGRSMPLVLVMVFTLIGWVLTEIFVDLPIAILDSASVPQWLTLSAIVAILSWCFGE